MWDQKLQSDGTAAAAVAKKEDDKLMVDSSSSALDSGFMSADQLSSSDLQQHYESNIPEQPADTVKEDHHTTELVAQKQQQQQQQQQQHLDSGLEIDTEAHSEMLLEQSIDDGLSEWFCNLKLKQNTATGSGSNNMSLINNLGGAGGQRKEPQQITDKLNITDSPTVAKRSKATKTVQPVEDHHQQQQEVEEPWEMCYKQDSDGDTYLHLAVTQGAGEIVRDLIKITPHPCLLDIQNDQQQSALHVAVLIGHVDIVRCLLLAGAESSLRDKYGNTPLHLACARGDVDVVRALTDRITATEETAAVSCASAAATAPAMMMDQRKNNRVILYPDLEQRNYDGEHCVHLAALNKSESVLRHLVVGCGANVNAREGKAGYTVLHMAVERGDENLVKFLLSECRPALNVEAGSYARWTAYRMAMLNRDQTIMNLLRNGGAQVLEMGGSGSSSEESDDSDYDDSEMSDVAAYGRHPAGLFYNANQFSGTAAINVV